MEGVGKRRRVAVYCDLVHKTGERVGVAEMVVAKADHYLNKSAGQ